MLSVFLSILFDFSKLLAIIDCSFKEIIVAKVFIVFKILFINSSLLFIVDFSKTLPFFKTS